MTFEQRMAELGVDLSDLPKHKRIPMLVINRKISEWKDELIDNPLDLYRYILHLTDIIDRVETRLVNLTGERDYLFERASGAGVLDCADYLYTGYKILV